MISDDVLVARGGTNVVVRPTPTPRGVAFFTLDEIIIERRCALSLENGVNVRAADMVVHDAETICLVVASVVDCVVVSYVSQWRDGRRGKT